MSEDSLNKIALREYVDIKVANVIEQLAERDRRYEDRDRANKDSVRAALDAAEKAAEKTEQALKEYKIGSNEWRDTLKDIVDRMPTRQELEKALDAINEKVVELREFKNRFEGQQTQIISNKGQSNWVVTVVIGVVGLVIAAIELIRIFK